MDPVTLAGLAGTAVLFLSGLAMVVVGVMRRVVRLPEGAEAVIHAVATGTLAEPASTTGASATVDTDTDGGADADEAAPAETIAPTPVTAPTAGNTPARRAVVPPGDDLRTSTPRSTPTRAGARPVVPTRATARTPDLDALDEDVRLVPRDPVVPERRRDGDASAPAAAVSGDFFAVPPRFNRF